MPDADRIGKLSRPWSKLYQKVCEGFFDSESLANDAMKPLQKDIERYGDAPLLIFKEVSIRLEGIRNSPLFLPTCDWNEENSFVRNVGSNYMHIYGADKRGIAIAISACEGLIHKLRNGESITGSLDEALIQGYVRRIYDCNFAAIAPFADENQTDMDSHLISQRLNEMDSYVDRHIDALASQIASKGRTDHLRLRRSIFQKVVTIEDDVFSLGNGR